MKERLNRQSDSAHRLRTRFVCFRYRACREELIVEFDVFRRAVGVLSEQLPLSFQLPGRTRLDLVSELGLAIVDDSDRGWLIGDINAGEANAGTEIWLQRAALIEVVIAVQEDTGIW